MNDVWLHPLGHMMVLLLQLLYSFTVRSSSHRSTTKASAWIIPRHLSRHRQSFQSTTGASSQLYQNTRWKEGDVVRLVTANESSNDNTSSSSSNMVGTVCEHRGSGWYTVQLQNDIVIKVRGTQLRRVTNTTTSVVVQVPPPPVRSWRGPYPPPPTIVDLDDALHTLVSDPIHKEWDRIYLQQQVQYHQSFQKWVVFTDLHCAPATLETSLQVLDTVHELAVQRNAGVLFLGDFWHHRGTLRVECLNAVLHHLRHWKVPMVLIPGNHDQVTLGGHNHGLTPLENAYRIPLKKHGSSLDSTVPGPLVFSHPTKFAGALFIPHIRDHATMESVLQSQAAHDASAIFVHADVTGAYMNDMIVSLGGVPPSLFPPNKLIYSGHFHKPHVVESSGRVIEYLGSPYQVTLSEAQQSKGLVVLNATEGWKCVERIPLNIGTKHFRVTSVEALLWLRPGTVTGSVSEDCNENIVHTGDRVVLTMNNRELEEIRRQKKPGVDDELESHVKLLRNAGVSVEIREVSDLPAQLFANSGESSDLEFLSPHTTWKAFVDDEIKRGAISNATAVDMMKIGGEILDELEGEGDYRVDIPVNATKLELTSVTVEGFGPFREKASYPLSHRGLVLLRGTNRDGGSDSNGSGKSFLAMSTLWCLTGSFDPRPLQDAKVADVVNDASKTARVTVRGFLNGIKFSITRSKTATKTGLVFILGDEDLTAQSAKETQVKLEEKFGCSAQVLARTMFHGQHALNDLLESSDTKLKEELSLVVPLAIWQQAATVTRKRARTATKNADELEGMLKVRSADLERVRVRFNVMKTETESKERLFRENDIMLAEKIQKCGIVDGHDGHGLVALEEQMTEASKRVSDLEDLRTLRVNQRDAELDVLEQRLREETGLINTVEAGYRKLQRDRELCVVHLNMAKDRVFDLERTWSVDLATGLAELTLPDSCPTCHQPLVNASDEEHSHATLKVTVESDIRIAMASRSNAAYDLEKIDESLAVSKKNLQQAQTSVALCQAELDKRLAFWSSLMNALEKEVSDARRDYDRISKRLAYAAKMLQEHLKMQSSKTELETEREGLLVAKASLASCEDDLAFYETTVQELQLQRDEKYRLAAVLTDLTSAFGQRGVQAFVLQNAVGLLQTFSQGYLDELSDGAQRLELSLDMGDRISRSAYVREVTGDFKERPLASLSGGQWRRCAIALNLGFSDLVSQRGKLKPSLLVLDEPLTFLDRSGRSAVGRVLRRLLRQSNENPSSFTVSTIIMILQDLAAEELEESFDCIDEVSKRNGFSSVNVDETTTNAIDSTELQDTEGRPT